MPYQTDLTILHTDVNYVNFDNPWIDENVSLEPNIQNLVSVLKNSERSIHPVWFGTKKPFRKQKFKKPKLIKSSATSLSSPIVNLPISTSQGSHTCKNTTACLFHPAFPISGSVNFLQLTDGTNLHSCLVLPAVSLTAHKYSWSRIF